MIPHNPSTSSGPLGEGTWLWQCRRPQGKQCEQASPIKKKHNKGKFPYGSAWSYFCLIRQHRELDLPPSLQPGTSQSPTYSQVDVWCWFNSFLSSLSSDQHLSGADRTAMVVINCLDIFCHKIEHFVEVVSKLNVMGLAFFSFLIQQTSCLYLTVTTEAHVAKLWISDLLWFRKVGFDVDFRASVSQSCIMFISVSCLTKVVDSKNSEIRHIHVYSCLTNPNKKAAEKLLL